MLIRPFEGRDLDAVMELWLQSNLQAHPFIAPSWWMEHLEEVKILIPQAEVYVHESSGVTDAFLGLMGEGDIAGLFVDARRRGEGIGKALLDHAKSLYPALTLSVYEKNEGAIRFYRREGFVLTNTRPEQETGERECIMWWKRR